MLGYSGLGRLGQYAPDPDASMSNVASARPAGVPHEIADAEQPVVRRS